MDGCITGDVDVYVLCSYQDGLDEPLVSYDYQKVYEKMKEEYEDVLSEANQTNSEKDETYIDEWGAVAVVDENWHEWNISKLTLDA